MKKVIAISLSPNTEKKDVSLALASLLNPFTYNETKHVEILEKWFRDYFSAEFVFSYTSGRAGLYEILQAYGIGKGDEVILQAFTCVALPNAILAVGATPIYVDVLPNATMDPKDLEKKITKKTKAIILQYTFGIPAEVEEIKNITKKYDVKLIEDCAHGIGISYKKKILGQFGDAAFFSFGRDKAFSSVFGGMVITNDKDLAERLESQYKKLSFPSVSWIAQQLFHPVAFSLITPLYDLYSLGKVLVVSFQKLHMLSFPVSVSEKKGTYRIADTMKLPGALAKLAFEQLQRIEDFNTRRTMIADRYMEAFVDKKDHFLAKESLPYLRFSLLSKNRDEIIGHMRKQHIYLGKWYTSPIDPKGVDFATIHYTVGSCPKAEKIANEIYNLPTFPTMSDEDVTRVIETLKKYV